MPNPRGRQPIAVNQPPSGGSLYPFVNPSPDILYLLGDFFVSFDDLADEIVYPLRVAWMYGFGTNSVSPPAGWPTPTHNHDLVIVDANDVVVFDSTLAIRFTHSTWDNRLLILEWTNVDRVCRCTKFTEWTQADVNDGQTITYDNYIEPSNGELQADCWYKLPKRITSIQVGLTNIKNKRIKLSEGYNVTLENLSSTDAIANILQITQQTTQVVEGTRLTNRVAIAAQPGTGLGAFPGCTGTDLTVKTINRAPANDFGNFTLDGEGCIRYQRPVGLLSNNPREFTYASFVLDPAASASAIQLHNNCKNCCDCTYFAQTYQGLKRQWFLYKDVADLAQETRDIYAQNRQRWLTQKTIRESHMIRARVSIDGNCKVRWGISLCNSGKCCVSEVSLNVIFVEYINGVITTPVIPQVPCLPSYIEGSEECDGPVPILPISNGPDGNFQTYKWNYSDPQTVTLVYGRHIIPDCKNVPETALKLRLIAWASWNNIGIDPTHTGGPVECLYNWTEGYELPIEVQNIITNSGGTIPDKVYGLYESSLIVVSSVNPLCTSDLGGSRCD